MADERFEGDEVAVAAEAGHDPEADGRQHRRVAERLSSVDVGEVGFDDDEVGPGDRVAEGEAVVGERTRVEDHPVDVAAGVVEAADELALDVRLEVDDVDVELGGVSPRSVKMSSRVSLP